VPKTWLAGEWEDVAYLRLWGTKRANSRARPVNAGNGIRRKSKAQLREDPFKKKAKMIGDYRPNKEIKL